MKDEISGFREGVGGFFFQAGLRDGEHEPMYIRRA